MAISDNHKKTLKGLHDTMSAAGQLYTFANPKAPMIAQLINSGHVAADHAYPDPADKAKVAVTLTPAGLAEVVPAPAPAAAPGPSFGQPPAPEATEGQDTTQEGQEGDAVGHRDHLREDRSGDGTASSRPIRRSRC